MSKNNDGGPAFPSHGSMGEVMQQGMTLRDYFAAKSLQGFIVNAGIHKALIYMPGVADGCYAMADAMLKARQA